MVKAQTKSKQRVSDHGEVFTAEREVNKTFGNGIVRKFDGDIIAITFGTAEKMFLFPIAFINGFFDGRR
jgi:hypothetical protein